MITGGTSGQSGVKNLPFSAEVAGEFSPWLGSQDPTCLVSKKEK